MQSFKLTSWNIEWADRLVTAMAADPVAAAPRLDAIAEEIRLLDPDVLLVGEGPKGEARASSFFARVAPGYRLVLRGDDAAYAIRGDQWLWFLLRDVPALTGQLGHVDRWRTLTESASEGDHRAGRWEVSYPVFDTGLNKLHFEVPKRHEHYRHPQVLQLQIAGANCEIIGCHLKSKINKVRPKGDPYAADFFDTQPALVADVVQSRIKLTTECTDIRHYIEARFAEDPQAPIVVCGDLNDGPGKERIERRFLYHDLVSSLQGDVFFAQRFLNHALFDFPQSARWSYDLGRDKLDPRREAKILLDHIMFTQSMTGHEGGFAYRARRNGGLVEHDVHHRVAAGRPRSAQTSDHKPVSMVFERRP